jgi:hypothetical protein
MDTLQSLVGRTISVSPHMRFTIAKIDTRYADRYVTVRVVCTVESMFEQRPLDPLTTTFIRQFPRALLADDEFKGFRYFLSSIRYGLLAQLAERRQGSL